MDSTNYVLLPWDLLQKYQVRAEKAAGQSPLASRMQAIIQLDTEERAEWTHRFATDASLSIGKIVKTVMLEREALWVVFGGKPAVSEGPSSAKAPAAKSGPGPSAVVEPRLFPSCGMAPPCVWTSRRASVRPRIARRASIVVDACSRVDVSAAVGATMARTVR